MTIVELFDDKPINNIVGGLVFRPDRIIYVGSLTQKRFTEKKLPVLRTYFTQKGLDTLEIEYVQVRRDSLQHTIEQLERIYTENCRCRFHVEVTGGEELTLIALGVLCQRHPELSMYQISGSLRSVRSYSLSDTDRDKQEVTCSNTAEENLMLHGASIVTANGEDMLEYGLRWDIEFMNDVSVMWDICCRGAYADSTLGSSCPNLWNRIVSEIGRLDDMLADRDDPNVILVHEQTLSNLLTTHREAELFDTYLDCFADNGLIEYYTDGITVEIVFKNDQVRFCLTKAGLLLELKTYMICMELLSQRGGDCLTGVTIDWDGDDSTVTERKYLYDPCDPDSTIDTLNEVDVIASCGLVPYFISCKNGKFTAEELYKLYSVGERFGTGYSKKIIVTTDLPYAAGTMRNTLLQRAADMGITVIENVHQMSDDAFCAAMQKAMELPKAKALL